MIASRLKFRSVASLALQQIALAALVSILVLTWLHIPDANAFEVAASVVLALLVVGVAGAGESWVALRLTGRPTPFRRLLTGALVVAVAALVWWEISLLPAKLEEHSGLYAGYLNSRLPASLRHLFSYDHVLNGLAWLGRIVLWLSAGLLAAAAFACITSDRPLRGVKVILRSGSYWLALATLFVAGAVLTGPLMRWNPGHSLGIEAFSLAARLLLAITLNAFAIAFLLQSMAAAVLGLYSPGTVVPEDSQLRTAPIP